MISEPSGYELVRIRGGKFIMGSPPEEKDWANDDCLQHEVEVSEFPRNQRFLLVKRLVSSAEKTVADYFLRHKLRGFGR